MWPSRAVLPERAAVLLLRACLGDRTAWADPRRCRDRARLKPLWGYLAAFCPEGRAQLLIEERRQQLLLQLLETFRPIAPQLAWADDVPLGLLAPPASGRHFSHFCAWVRCAHRRSVETSLAERWSREGAVWWRHSSGARLEIVPWLDAETRICNGWTCLSPEDQLARLCERPWIRRGELSWALDAVRLLEGPLNWQLLSQCSARVHASLRWLHRELGCPLGPLSRAGPTASTRPSIPALSGAYREGLVNLLRGEPRFEDLPLRLRAALGEPAACREAFLRGQPQIFQAGRLVRAWLERGISCMLLKGAALLAALNLDCSRRPLGDVDVLVPRESFPDALRLANSLGWKPDPGRAPHAINLHGPHRTYVDLHWSPLFDARGRGQEGLWWRDSSICRWEGLEVRVPSRERLVLHALAHAWLEPSPQHALVDVVLLLRENRLDWDKFCHLTETEGSLVPVRSLLALYIREIGSGVPDFVVPRLARAQASALDEVYFWGRLQGWRISAALLDRCRLLRDYVGR